MMSWLTSGVTSGVPSGVPVYQWAMLGGLIVVGLLILLIASGANKRRRNALREYLGFDGEVVYADSGRQTKSLVSSTYGIVAKPDFILRLDTGVYALVEYKSRENGRLYASDVAQVKASVIAAREQYDVKLAYVISGSTRHEISVGKSSASLYREIQELATHARDANAGKVVNVYASNPAQCRTCAYKQDCQKP